MSAAEENLSNKFHFRPPPVTSARGEVLGTWTEASRILKTSDSYSSKVTIEIRNTNNTRQAKEWQSDWWLSIVFNCSIVCLLLLDARGIEGQYLVSSLVCLLMMFLACNLSMNVFWANWTKCHPSQNHKKILQTKLSESFTIIIIGCYWLLV